MSIVRKGEIKHKFVYKNAKIAPDRSPEMTTTNFVFGGFREEEF